MNRLIKKLFQEPGLRIAFVLSVTINLLLIGIVIFKLSPEFPGYVPGLEVPEEIRRYPLLSPRILQEYTNDTLINFLPLRDNLHSIVEPWGESFGLYFEYLPTGISIGSNSTLGFYTGSLVKVPIVMAFLQKVENGEVNLNTQVRIEDRHADMAYGDLWKKVGQTITLHDAVEETLTKSDNTALMILRDYVTAEDLENVHKHLDIPFIIEQRQVVLSAKEYSSVLKALYFSSVLDLDRSQFVLDQLGKSIAKNQIDAGIPSGIKVAHKIGVLPDQMYSDCGIVYEPRRPYILCMISGSDEATANERMKQISEVVYQYVSRVNE